MMEVGCRTAADCRRSGARTPASALGKESGGRRAAGGEADGAGSGKAEKDQGQTGLLRTAEGRENGRPPPRRGRRAGEGELGEERQPELRRAGAGSGKAEHVREGSWPNRAEK